jgi:hypothetical protein
MTDTGGFKMKRSTRIRRPLAAALCAAANFSFAFLGAGAAADENPAKVLLALSVEEAGGMEAARQWATRIDKGQVTANWPGWGELHASYTRWVKKPDKMKIDQDFTAYDHPFFFTYFYNEGEAWVVVNLGTRQNETYTRRMVKNMRTTDGLAYYLAECDTIFLVTDVPDDSLVAAAAIDRVGIVDHGDTVLFDLDKTSRLPVRRIEDGGSTQVLFGDYRETRAGKIAHRLTIHQPGGRTEEQVLDEIVFDEPIDDTIFEEFRPNAKKE